MKNVYFILLLSMFYSCDKTEENNIELLTGNSYEKYLTEYGLSDYSEEFECVKYNSDSTFILFISKDSGNMYIRTYETINKTNVIYMKKVLDTLISINEGYGVISSHKIMSFFVKSFYQYKDTCSFILWGFDYLNYEEYFNDPVYSDLYFVSNFDCKYKRTIAYPSSSYVYSTLSGWYKNSFIVNSKFAWAIDDPSYYTNTKKVGYTLNGDSIFDLSSFNYKHDFVVDYYHYINYSNRIFRCINTINNSILWETNEVLSSLPKNARIEWKIVDSNDEYIRCEFSYILYDGTKGNNTYKLFLKTGTIIEE